MIPDLTGSIETTDNCAAAVTVTQLPAASTTMASEDGMTHNVTIIATDGAGNVSTCLITLTGQDETDPVITTDCSTLATDVDLTASCEMVIPDLTGSIATTDNCAAAVTVSQSPTAATAVASADGMTHDVTITATDGAGNTTTCTVTLTGQDVTDPVITTDCSTLAEDIDLTASCEIVIPDLTGSIATTDNCAAAVTVSQSPTAATAVTSADGMTHDVTITATDGAGNTTTCTVTLTGQDVTCLLYTSPSPRD